MKSIPEDLSNKIKTLLQTPANNADPKMSITVVRAKDTVMDNTYWTTEVIRTKEGLGDLSVAARRLKPYGGPDSLYNIYVDNGVVKTAIRAYPDYQKDGWEDQFTIGAGTACAICFDGYWKLYRGKWQMVTSEKPWIFWVNGGVLYTQYWDEELTRFEMATSVSKVKAIRGWKNVNMPEVDQGVVVSYIKTNGKIYYRNYCWQSDDSFVWENERELTDFTESYLSHNIFITNDYRMGIIAENTSHEISMIITDRAWAGMAIAPEYIKASVSGSIEMVEIEKINTYNTEYISASVGGTIENLYAMSDNAFRNAENFSIEMLDEEDQPYQNWGFRIRVITAHDMTTLDYLDFTLKDSNNTPFAVTGITKTDKREYEFSTTNFNNAYGDLTLSFIGSGNTKGEAGQNMDGFNITFTPQNLVPTFIPLPEVEVIWNE